VSEIWLNGPDTRPESRQGGIMMKRHAEVDGVDSEGLSQRPESRSPMPSPSVPGV
jgi:hypothetical protein